MRSTSNQSSDGGSYSDLIHGDQGNTYTTTATTTTTTTITTTATTITTTTSSTSAGAINYKTALRLMILLLL